jgi:hypothetical protein
MIDTRHAWIRPSGVLVGTHRQQWTAFGTKGSSVVLVLLAVGRHMEVREVGDLGGTIDASTARCSSVRPVWSGPFLCDLRAGPIRGDPFTPQSRQVVIKWSVAPRVDHHALLPVSLLQSGVSPATTKRPTHGYGQPSEHRSRMILNDPGAARVEPHRRALRRGRTVGYAARPLPQDF